MKRLLLAKASGAVGSALEPAGTAATEIADLFFWMVAGATIIWLVVIALATYAILSGTAHPKRKTASLVIGGGAIFPTLTLTVLLCYSLPMLPRLHQPPSDPAVTIEVAGVRWWWRVRYQMPDGSVVESANEIHLPIGKDAEFKLVSEDVIHSFWIPSLGGKMDMIPGRRNRLKLHPTREGLFRGACAEYCGTAHAQMAFNVVVSSEDDFQQFLETISKPASSPTSELAATGEQLFLQKGCSGCHSIRGLTTAADVAPDLTHFALRRQFAAGLVDLTPENLRRWIRRPDSIKPGVQMPGYRWLSDQELDALIAYLQQLR